MTANSFKQMVKSGVIKRADAAKIRLDDIHEEDGFNLRIEGEDLDASIEALKQHIMDGGMVPALEVRPRPDGGVYLVDGHRRRRAFIKAREEGAPIEWISVVQFEGNDAERITRIMTSAEGRELKPLEIAAGYKRLRAFDLSNSEIARRVNKTPQHVEQLMILANANMDVQALVRDGMVSATEAIKAVREHGDDAGAYLLKQLEKAQQAGKSKVTAGAIRGKSLSRKHSELLATKATDFYKSLSHEPDDGVQKILSGELVEGTVTINAKLLCDLIDCFEQIEMQMLREAS